MNWITSNRNDRTPWHSAVYTGKGTALSGRYYVTACTGRAIGGNYGSTVVKSLPDGSKLCAVCARMLREGRLPATGAAS